MKLKKTSLFLKANYCTPIVVGWLPSSSSPVLVDSPVQEPLGPPMCQVRHLRLVAAAFWIKKNEEDEVASFIKR